MAKDIAVQETPKIPLSVNKWRFITWMFIITIIMLFASQTSAYLVKRAEGAWNEFEIPKIFWYSTVILLISSITMHFSYNAAKKDNQGLLKSMILVTFVLGMSFMVMQYLGWQDLQKQGIYLKGNVSGSFFYVFTGLHVAHLVMGVGVLIATMIFVFRSQVNAGKTLLIENCTTFWHFLDLLWLYLFVFLLYFR
ncbi:MAG: heme-copper oxidase subunit III [Spirosomataceae bacterium]